MMRTAKSENATAARPTGGPAFLRFVAPIVETLKELGNSGTAAEVTNRVIERLKIADAELAEATSNGQSRVRNQIAWARFYLAKADYIDAPRHGVWTLTKTGQEAKLDGRTVLALFKNARRKFARQDPVEESSDSDDAVVGVEALPDSDGESHKDRLLGILRSLPAAGFERVCQRLLRESGFQQVMVTGRSGDGGIDGHGVLEINPLVTFRVLFQCKRFGDTTSVTPSHVRDFRGAMEGRADKGLILTTGVFTPEARKEATPRRRASH